MSNSTNSELAMTSKRPAENSEESEEKRQRVDESLNMDNNLQTTAGPALKISPPLIESNVSRVAEEVTFHKATEQRPGQTSSAGSSQCSALPRGQLSVQVRYLDNLRYIRTAAAASRISKHPLPSSSTLLRLGKSVARPRPDYDGISAEVYQFQVADDWCSIKVEGPEHTVLEIKGFPDDPFASGSFQNAFRTKRIMPCRFLTGTDFVFKQHNIDEYAVSKENDITHLTEESLKELERANERKTAKEVQVAAVCRSLCYHFSQECNTKIKDFGREISVIPSVHVKLKSGQFPPWGSIEPYIQGRWAKFINNDGQVLDIGERPRKPVQEFSKKCLAFSHWTYKQFQGKAVVCDLQGADFKLTDLEIASSDGSLFGMGNLSDYALKMFKKKHTCNEYCAALELEALESFKPNDLEQSVASPEGGNHSPET